MTDKKIKKFDTRIILPTIAFFVAIALVAGAVSIISADKFAVVDMQKVIMADKGIILLKEERIKDLKALQGFVNEANVAISKEKGASAKKKLGEKYSAELNDQKSAFDMLYAQKLVAADTALHNRIAQVARDNGYKYVFTKTSLIYGADDITDLVIEAAKEKKEDVKENSNNAEKM